MFKSVNAYFFLAGICIGGYTNFFAKIVISGLVLYIVQPDMFNPSKFSPLYQTIYEKTYPYLSKIYTIEENPLIKNKLPPLNPKLKILN